MTRTRLPVAIAWSAALIMALAPPTIGQGSEMVTLGAAVEDFLVNWMRGNPDEASKRYLSKLTADRPQILPAERSSESPALGQDAQRNLTTELTEVRQQLWGQAVPDRILEPTRSPNAIPDIADAIQKRRLELLPMERPPVLAFRIRRWDDVAWTGSAGPRHRAVFDGPDVAERAMYGVIAQLRSSRRVTKPMPVLLVWRNEAPGTDAHAWRLVTLFPILTQ